MRRFAASLLMTVALIAALAPRPANADVLLDQTNLVALPSVAAPSEYSFTAGTAQALTLTLSDLQTPAAFVSLQVAVTLGDVLVGSASVDSTTHKATLAIPAAAGNYALHVIGAPDTTQGFGSFGVCVAPATSATSCVAAYSFSGNIQSPATTSSTGKSTLSTNFTSTTAGTYTVTITDAAFPVALQSIGGGISQGSTPITSLAAGTTQVTLAAGTSYQLLIAAIANTTAQAGLYGVLITDPAGTAVFNRTLPVGTMAASTIVDNSAAQSLSLSLTDYAYPAALAGAGVAVTQGSKALATLTAPGNIANFAAAAGNLEVWQYATAGAQPGVYSLDLSIYQSSGTASATSLLATTKVVNPGGAAATSYAFVVTLTSAGTYNLVAKDFQFPSAFQSISATVAQKGAVLQQTSSGDFTVVQGPVIVLVNATPPQSGSGIFGVTVQTSGASPQVLLDQTQAVGGAFSTHAINLGTSGSYNVTLTDLGFPANFQYLAVVVSQGSQVLGKIYAGGTFNFSGTPGKYVLTFVTTPASPQHYGLYSVTVASSPPTITLAASPSSVTAGGATTLTWSSQNATACTASGGAGWTGTQTTSGSLSIAIAATETLTLTCTGPGGSAAQSVSVTATAAPASHSGGGGSLGISLLAALAALVLAGRRNHRSSGQRMRSPGLNRSRIDG
jgi:hypothetical protein